MSEWKIMHFFLVILFFTSKIISDEMYVPEKFRMNVGNPMEYERGLKKRIVVLRLFLSRNRVPEIIEHKSQFFFLRLIKIRSLILILYIKNLSQDCFYLNLY